MKNHSTHQVIIALEAMKERVLSLPVVTPGIYAVVRSLQLELALRLSEGRMCQGMPLNLQDYDA